jgi:methyltransferase-like protein 23
MPSSPDVPPAAPPTSPALAGLPLHEYRLRVEGREWSIVHTGEVLTVEEEQRFLSEAREARPPYGIILWPAAIALAHDVASRAEALRGRRVLELGAGTGLPGIVAASLGARVVQTDRHELALEACRLNGARNAQAAIEYRLADWNDWHDDARYDLILGSDVLYGRTTHPLLRRIFATNLAPGGRVLLSDPFREPSLRLLEALAADGWAVSMSKWNVAAGAEPRPIGVFELTAPSTA